MPSNPFTVLIASFFFLMSALSPVGADETKNRVQGADFWELAGFRVDDQASSELPGYRPLKRMLVGFAPPEMLAGLRNKFPDTEFVLAKDIEGQDTGGDFEAVMLSCGSPQAMTKAGNVAWILSFSAGIEKCIETPKIAARLKAGEPIIVTNSRGAAASVIAEHAIGMTMSLARGLHRFRDEQAKSQWSRGILSEGNVTTTIGGKTMLVLGLGAIGKEVARRANALGMKVMATRNRSRSGPNYVTYVGLADETLALAKQADVIVNALPLTDSTQALVNEEFFAEMKETALYVSVGRGGTTDSNALLAALKNKQIAGAGLDVTDPEPLPSDHSLWKQQNLIITPHLAGSGGEAREKTFSLAVENIRRYKAGEPLLNVADTKLGY